MPGYESINSRWFAPRTSPAPPAGCPGLSLTELCSDRDYEAASKLDSVCENPFAPALWAAAVREQQAVGRFAVVRGKTVGFSLYGSTAGVVTLYRVAVVRGYRRRGVGRALVEGLKGVVLGNTFKHSVAAHPLEPASGPCTDGRAAPELAAVLFLRSCGFRAEPWGTRACSAAAGARPAVGTYVRGGHLNMLWRRPECAGR